MLSIKKTHYGVKNISGMRCRDKEPVGEIVSPFVNFSVSGTTNLSSALDRE